MLQQPTENYFLLKIRCETAQLEKVASIHRTTFRVLFSFFKVACDDILRSLWLLPRKAVGQILQSNFEKRVLPAVLQDEMPSKFSGSPHMWHIAANTRDLSQFPSCFFIWLTFLHSGDNERSISSQVSQVQLEHSCWGPQDSEVLIHFALVQSWCTTTHPAHEPRHYYYTQY